MSRLIDADELMESIRNALGIKSMTKSLLLPAERTIIDQIDSAPTVDAVPVVRCKDCKHAKMTIDGDLCKYCDLETDGDGFPIELYLEADWFCAGGERKAEQDG